MSVVSTRGFSLDKVGAWASALCAVHCALTGVALGLLSVVGLGFLGSHVAEGVFISVAVVLGTVAIVHGLRKHGSIVPALIFVLGLGFITVSHFAFHHHGPMGTLFSVLGGLSLVAFHIVNLRMHSGCACDSCGHVSEPETMAVAPLES
jgi:hypothetical protein